MHRFFVLLLLCFICVFNSGCARVSQPIQKIWGSSTSLLEKERKDAISKVYDCAFDKCFDEVLNILEEQGAQIFIKDKAKGIIVAMGIKKAVTTTEVGIFFTSLEEAKTNIEIASPSRKAKRITSEIIFAGLDLKCSINKNN